MNEKEKNLLEKLSQCYDDFLNLKDKHVTSNIEFASAIHICQYLIAARVASRIDPEIWNER